MGRMKPNMTGNLSGCFNQRIQAGESDMKWYMVIKTMNLNDLNPHKIDGFLLKSAAVHKH